MKKMIVISLIILICMSNAILALAGNEIVCTYDNLNEELVVSGVIENGVLNTPLVLQIKKNDELVGVSQVVTQNDGKGNVGFRFEPYKFSLDALSGDYSIIVSGHFLNQEISTNFYYYGIDTQFSIFSNINTKISQNDDVGLGELLINSGSLLGISDVYSTLKAGGKNIFNTLIMGKTYTLPADISNDGNISLAKEEISIFKQDYLQISTIATFEDVSTKAEFNSWFENYSKVLMLDINDSNTSIDESKIYPYFVSSKAKDLFIKRIANAENLLSISAVKDKIYEASLLTEIETEHFSKTREIMEKFPTLFNTNQQNFAKLNSIQQPEVYTKVAKTAYKSYLEVAQAFDKVVDSMLPKSTPSTGDTGSKGGGWGTSVSGSSVNLSTKMPKTALAFNDLTGNEWAIDAVTYLYDKKIISGTTNVTFNPNGNVTRAEFVKMLVLASNMALVIDTTSTFADVNANDWFAPFVATAQKNNLVTGFETGEFSPYNNITREDMAVLIVRALNIKKLDFVISFNDNDTINSYAKEAVNSLYSLKMINGVGENMFAPKSNATRAQAAQILYKAIKN